MYSLEDFNTRDILARSDLVIDHKGTTVGFLWGDLIQYETA